MMGEWGIGSWYFSGSSIECGQDKALYCLEMMQRRLEVTGLENLISLERLM